ncbi:MAG TPA: ABC transporter substrate-binding protein [Bradyrhizobium sp.]|uniref:ABC transporter substrate-binding protein n=1 Tax=Bradyrhizobium sp. TaxID=376 RepID=UPI002B48824D|nr:ABC transporter substrate-binding protein [Bradyrhizobium sp.]HKO71890.1 ABC transporter substrate-binding protein [Bradyrhizobium sp.]
MRRRHFIALTASAIAWPLAAHAQQPGMPVIGFLHSASPEPYAPQLNAFRQSLKEAGYVDGQNVTIEYRWAEDQIARLPILAAELAHRQVSVIAAGGSPVSALAAKSATTTIPIVFMNAADPVAIGLVTSFNRPGGNVTGATLLSAELVSKRLGILHDLLPSIKNIAVLVNPTRPGVDAQKAHVQAAAQTLGLALHILNASSERDFDAVFQAVVSHRDDALVVTPDALFLDRRFEIADLATRYKIPTMYELRYFVEAGGLISYGANALDMYRQGATLIREILMGKKPADLPVLQPTKFELAINMKTAGALDIEVPSSMQLLADEVIE